MFTHMFPGWEQVWPIMRREFPELALSLGSLPHLFPGLGPFIRKEVCILSTTHLTLALGVERAVLQCTCMASANFSARALMFTCRAAALIRLLDSYTSPSCCPYQTSLPVLTLSPRCYQQEVPPT